MAKNLKVNTRLKIETHTSARQIRVGIFTDFPQIGGPSSEVGIATLRRELSA